MLAATLLVGGCVGAKPRPVPSEAAPPSLGSVRDAPVDARASDAGQEIEASVAMPPAGKEAVASAADVLQEAALERRVYRHVHVGMIDRAQRTTWVFLRGAKSARLRMIFQNAKQRTEMVRMNGRENDESTWGSASITDYVGTREGISLNYRFEAVHCESTDPPPCGGVRTPLLLSCRSESASVLRSGAVLRAGGAGKVASWGWVPPARERVPVLRCLIEGETRSFDSPLMFADGRDGSPGIEWAFENSDMVVQQGAYRWMPAPP